MAGLVEPMTEDDRLLFEMMTRLADKKGWELSKRDPGPEEGTN